MIKRVNLIGFACITVFCVLLIFSYNQKAIIPNVPLYGEQHVVEDYLYNLSTTPFIREVLYRQKFALDQEARDYAFPHGESLKDYAMVSGGKPLRSIILTTWRSGSTFLGDILNAVPATYYHYEPLLDYGIVQIRGAPLAETALTALKNLLNCDYDEMQAYLEYGKTHTYLFTHNTRLWNRCEPSHLCWDASFLNEFCKLFPFQMMKIVRLRLKLAEELLRDESLNVKVVLLVRDPRGTLQSRKHRDWCPGNADCDKPDLLCADMVSDYNAAVQLAEKYPNTFKAVRYEDLSLNPRTMTKDIFDFYGLKFHANVNDFLESHTKSNIGGVSSTFRDSRSAPFHWRSDLNASEVQYIEESCEKAMRLWGYVKHKPYARDTDTLTSFSIV
ncbi:carbohydrate sulfotransferase 5-like [Atheta coriaria]|uniref:carbohydrate sulfotransferase 5-like n=1 Tax=Dalotia coriaria TaxID=877792 RepID=UPI0031F38D22